MVSVALAVVLVTITARWVAATIMMFLAVFIAVDTAAMIYDVAQPGGSPGDILAEFAMVLHVLALFTVAFVTRSALASRSRGHTGVPGWATKA